MQMFWVANVLSCKSFELHKFWVAAIIEQKQENESKGNIEVSKNCKGNMSMQENNKDNM